jgi:hypothetical protein
MTSPTLSNHPAVMLVLDTSIQKPGAVPALLDCRLEAGNDNKGKAGPSE